MSKWVDSDEKRAEDALALGCLMAEKASVSEELLSSYSGHLWCGRDGSR